MIATHPTTFRLAMRATCLALLAVLAPTPAGAQAPEPPQVLGIRIGFDGRYKLGCWTPVDVLLRGGSQAQVVQVEIIAPDGDDTPSRIPAPRAVQLLPGQDAVVRMTARLGQMDGSVVVKVLAEGRRLAARTFLSGVGANRFPAAIDSTDRLIVQIGPDIGLDELARRRSVLHHEPLQIARLADARELPTRWYGYESVDTLLLVGSQTAAFEALAPGTVQRAALDEWLALGGRLVCAVGVEAPALLAPGAPLAGLAPGRFEVLQMLPSTTPIEDYASAAVRIPRGVAGSRQIPAAQLADVQGVVDAAEGKLPLVVRSARGLGQVTFLAVDLDRQPFSNWPSRVAVVNRLLGGPPMSFDDEDDPDADAHSPGYLGYSDLAGQLRSALDHFTGVRVIPFSVVAGLVFAYILLIGPGDYLLLKLVLRRMELTWITFPLIVVGISLGAYLLAWWAKGTELRLNQVDLVDIDLDGGLVRGTTWFTVFSPRTTSYDLSLEVIDLPTTTGEPLRATSGRANPAIPQKDDANVVAWLGLPGSGLGGMAAGGNLRAFSRPYEFANSLNAMHQVPLAVWSSKSFVGRWCYPTALDMPRRLTRGSQNVLSGEVNNPLGLSMQDCLLVYDRWAYDLGTLEAGQSAALRPGQHIDLQTVLKSYQVLHDQRQRGFVTRATPYDREGSNVPTIVRQMMFHEASGGRRYAGLVHRYQGFVDLSHLVQVDRAILVGRVDAPVARVVDDGRPLGGDDDRRWLYCRLVLPVAFAESDPSPESQP